MAGLLLGITLLLWSLSLLGIMAVSNTVLGLFALVTGIVWIVSSLGVVNVPAATVRRTPQA